MFDSQESLRQMPSLNLEDDSRPVKIRTQYPRAPVSNLNKTAQLSNFGTFENLSYNQQR